MSYVRGPLVETVRMNPYTGAIPGISRAQAVTGPATAVLASRGAAGVAPGYRGYGSAYASYGRQSFGESFGLHGALGEDLTAYCDQRGAVPGPDGDDCVCKKNYVEDPARGQCSVVCKAGFHPDASRRFCLPDATSTPSQPAPQAPDLFGACPSGWSKDPVTGLLCIPPLWTTNQNLPCPEGTLRDPTGFACWPTGNLPIAMPTTGCPAGTAPDDLTGTRCVKNTIPGPLGPVPPPIQPGSGTAPPIGTQPAPTPAPASASSNVPLVVGVLAVLAIGGVWWASQKKTAA